VADKPATTDQSDAAPGSSKKKLLIIVVLLAAVGGGSAFLLLGKRSLTPAENLQLALKLLDERDSNWKVRRALEITDDLEELGYVDPDFPAGIPFVRGMAAFHSAREFKGAEQQKRYLAALEYLELAYPRGKPEERQLEQTWAMGVALQNVGLATRARDMLMKARTQFPPGPEHNEASLLLLQNLIDQQSSDGLAEARRISDGLQGDESLTFEQRETAALLRANVLNLLGLAQEAQEALKEVTTSGSGEQETIILQARALMSEAQHLTIQGDKAGAVTRYQAAQELLVQVTAPGSPEGPAARAMFMMGLCAERLETYQSAIDYYQRTIRRFKDSDEHLAATLRLASLMQREGRNEEALSRFREVLRAIVRPDDFRNRWLTLEQFEQDILLGWSNWLDSQHFDEALKLAEAMPPLIDPVRALEFAARTNEEWAKTTELNWQKAATRDKLPLRDEMRQHWAASGEAFGRLAASVRTEKRYPEVVWTSALHYHNGYDFQKSLAATDEFIRTDPPTGVPRAHVHRGRVLMDLDRLKDALSSFQFVLENAPTDPSAFEARFRIGLCQLESGRPDEAEMTWRAILDSEELDPSANEWRMAKFALGRLLVHQASNEYRRSIPAEDAEPTDEQATLRASAYRRWQEAILLLAEYLERYTDSAERLEARYLLARSLQSAANEPRQRLSDSLPANARTELFREIRRQLNEAITQYGLLQRDLLKLRNEGQLDEYGQELYRVSYLEVPNALFAQELYADALANYQTLRNRFSDHVTVLTAYIQMARCYDHMKEPDNALRQLEQARVILSRLPDEAFLSASTGMSREEWSQWIDWARQIHNNRRNST
jgi:tetratricopeptide (TPR) repeat protein